MLYVLLGVHVVMSPLCICVHIVQSVYVHNAYDIDKLGACLGMHLIVRINFRC